MWQRKDKVEGCGGKKMKEGEKIPGKYLLITMERAGGKKLVLDDGKIQVVKNMVKKKKKGRK